MRNLQWRDFKEWHFETPLMRLICPSSSIPCWLKENKKFGMERVRYATSSKYSFLILWNLLKNGTRASVSLVSFTLKGALKWVGKHSEHLRIVSCRSCKPLRFLKHLVSWLMPVYDVLQKLLIKRYSFILMDILTMDQIRRWKLSWCSLNSWWFARLMMYHFLQLISLKNIYTHE